MDKKGVALLIVITTVAILSIFMVELNYKTNLYIRVSSNYKASIQAYYLAKSSVNIALTRLAIYKKMQTIKLGNIKLPQELLDIIWSFPFAYPFELGFGKGTAFNVDKDIQKFGRFEHSIESLDNGFNINSVVLEDEQEKIFISLLESIYDRKADEDDEFAKKYTREDFDIIANNIIDWIDLDGDSRNGGDEDAYYLNKDREYKPRNGPIPIMSELRLIDGVDETIYKIIKHSFNIFSSSVNINDVGIEVWSILLPSLSMEDIKEIVKEKDLIQIPFTSEDDVKDWLFTNFGIQKDLFNPNKVPLSFKRENFKILAKGLVGKTSRSVICYISDMYEYLNSYGFLNKKKYEKQKKTTIVPSVVLWELD